MSNLGHCLRVTLLIGIEMSSFGYRDFSIFFSASRFLTSNLQDVEAQKSTHGLIPEEDDLDAEQQNAEF